MNVFKKEVRKIPKVLENVEEQVLEKAKEYLLANGFQNLGMRTIAEACDISVGTLYNYFDSKEMLVANIMLKDWKEAMREAVIRIQNDDSFMNGLHTVYEFVATFINMYSSTWDEYLSDQYRMPMSNRYHEMLVEQITEIVDQLLIRFPQDVASHFDILISETLISAVRNPQLSFEDFQSAFQKILL